MTAKIIMISCSSAMAELSSSMPESYFCIDVECVATGPRHDARSVALIVIIDKNENIVLKRTVKQEAGYVFSYLTPLTGLQRGDLDKGIQFEHAMLEVKWILSPDVVLVGQGIDYAIQLLHLVKGIDYDKSIDLGELFKTMNPRINYFTLSHEANTLLQQGMFCAKLKVFQLYPLVQHRFTGLS